MLVAWIVCHDNQCLCFAGVWTSAFSLGTEHKIKRNQLLTTIPSLAKEWRLSLELKVDNFGSGFKQVLHMSIGGKGVGKFAKYGDRTPAIWTHPSRGFQISSAVRGKHSFGKYIKKLPSPGEWVKIEIGQALESSEMIYYIAINGRRMVSVTNPEASEFENVMVFTSSPWYSPVSGSIRNLVIENMIHKYVDERALYEGNINVT